MYFLLNMIDSGYMRKAVMPKGGKAQMKKARAKTPGGERPLEILERLKVTYPDWKCALHFSNPVELLFAVMLSAQCTDKRVNMVTPRLFAAYTTVKAYAKADILELEKIIHSTGFYHNKAKNMLGSAKMIVKDFGGEVPQTMEELLLLPGVARKTANVVLSVAFQKNEGVVVDTHVTRLANRLGLTKEHDPVKIEKDLVKLYPQKEWHNISLLLIYLGRNICVARKPRCGVCPLNDMCPKVGVTR